MSLSSTSYDLSFIVPVYNAQAYLARCIDSLLIVNAAKEIILIDDGSSDNSLSIMQDYAEKHPEIRVISQANKGVAAVRNLGIELAQGRYLQFVDADDFLIYSHYANLIAAADSYEIDLIQWLMIEQDLSQAEPYKYMLPLDIERPKRTAGTVFSGENYAYHMVLNDQVFSCCTSLYRTAYLHTQNVRFDESLTSCEDSLFLLDAMLSGSTVKVLDFPHYLYCYHRHAESHTKRANNLNAFRDIFVACEKFTQRENHYTAQSELKAGIIRYAKLNVYRYAYLSFYRHFNEHTKAQAKRYFTPEILALLAEHNISLEL